MNNEKQLVTGKVINTRYLAKLREAKMQVNNEHKKRAIYARVSTKEQAMTGFGIDAQLSNIKSSLRLQGVNLDDVELYIDDGYSAKNLNRPNMQKLLQDVMEQKINEIIIYKLDRLARNVIDTYELLQFFLDQQCELKAVVDNLDIHSANGRLLVGVLAIIAQWERETISERTIDAVIEMLIQGRYPFGQIPFGWDKDADGYLHINEKEAGYIVFCANLAVAGNTMKEIEYKAQIEYPDYIKRSETIKRLLLRTLNIGKLIYLNEEYSCPPILNEKQYNKVILMINKRYKVRDEDNYYFGNKIKDACGEICERTSTNKKLKVGMKKYYYYYCAKCKKRISQDRLVEATLVRICSNSEHKLHNAKIKQLTNRLHKLDTKASIIYREYSVDQLDAKTYGSMLGNLEKEKEKIITRLQMLQRGFVLTTHEWKNMSNRQRKIYIDEYVYEIIVDVTLGVVISITFI